MQSVSETKVAVRRPHMVGIGVPYIISFSSNQNINREKAKENKRKKDTPPPPPPPPQLEPKWAFTDTFNNLTVSRPTGCRGPTT